jgi:hypothetical protein
MTAKPSVMEIASAMQADVDALRKGLGMPKRPAESLSTRVCKARAKLEARPPSRRLDLFGTDGQDRFNEEVSEVAEELAMDAEMLNGWVFADVEDAVRGRLCDELAALAQTNDRLRGILADALTTPAAYLVEFEWLDHD